MAASVAGADERFSPSILNATLDNWSMVDTNNDLFYALAVTTALGILPLLAVTVTSFAKIAIVFFIVRNALGLQQAPPNLVLYALAFILTAYIARPVVEDAWLGLSQQPLTFQSFNDYETAAKIVVEPLRRFLDRNTDEVQKEFFIAATEHIWSAEGEAPIVAHPDDLSVVVPAFVLTELTQAFEIGFLLFLPFVAIDIILTTILMALGMMMVPPTILSVPFKLLLFVLVDGWTKIVQGLILTYG